ncbi:MAG: DUF4349 domain-containing protein [Anaerolineales bacterium]|nr:DUF4349 domain-containing protein [Anaerolineales bacterium]
MKRILPFSLIVIASLILAACGSYRASATEMPSVGFYDALGGDVPMEAPAAAGPEQEVFTTARDVNESVSVANAAQVERIVIKNADLAIVVADVEGRMKNIQIMAEQMGGFVVSSNLYQSYTSDYVEVPEAQIVIRVPSEKLEEAMNQIKKDVVEVQSETVSGQDVTAEYVDLKSRLKNLEAAEAQLDEILKTATETEDVVNVFNQLVYYREQIELVKGQIKYYDEAAALSSISVRIIAEATVQPIVIGKWEPKGIALEAIQDLINFMQGFTEFLIRFVIFTLPALIIIAIPLYLLFIGVRALARKMRGNKAKKQQPQEEDSVEKK